MQNVRCLGAVSADADATGAVLATAAGQASLLAAMTGASSIGSLMTHAVVNLAAGANQSVVAATASQQIWVYGYELHANVAGTVCFQDEDDTALTGVMPVGALGGVAVMSPYPIFKVATGKALEIDIVTSEIDGVIQYRKVAV